MFRSKHLRLIGLFSMLCIVVFAFTQQATAEQRRYLLLETDAAYQLEFSFLDRLDSAPPILSIYTYKDEDDPFLNISRLYKGLPGNNVTHVNMVFRTPQGYQRAIILVQSDHELNEDLSIERINRFSHESKGNLAEMIVNNQVYTGLIVDARGLGVKRGISPQIWAESGELIYGGVAAPYDFIQTKGVMSYGHSVSPELIKRVTIPGKLSYTAPLFVDAKDVIGLTKTGVVISQEAAETILCAIRNYDFLAQYAVVMLVD